MKIVITQIGHPNFRGGGNKFTHHLAGALARRGHNVSAVFLSPRRFLKDKPNTAYSLMFIPDSRNPLINCARAARAVRKLLRNKRSTDSCVVISLGYEGMYLSRTKHRVFKFIAAAHNPFLRYVEAWTLFHVKWLLPRNWGKFLYEFSVLLDRFTKLNADVVQAPSRLTAGQCEETYRIPKEKICVVPCGIDIGAYSLRSVPQEKNILFIGGTSHYKGLDVLFRALPAVFEKHPDARVVVLGEMKREEASLRALAKKLGVYEHIVWRGLVSPDEMPKFYREAYAAVFPSRVESFLLGALEAMVCGVPIVVTQVGVMPEVIEDGLNGCIINSEDAPGLAEKIIFLLDDPERARRIGLAGRKTIEEKGLSWDSVAEQFEKIIESKTGISV